MHPYAEEMDLGGPDGGGEDLRVQRWYTGRGSLWRPPSNLARITRQETRLIKSAIQNDSSGQMQRILSSSQSSLFASLRASPTTGPQRCSNGYAPRRRTGRSTDPLLPQTTITSLATSTALLATVPLAPVEGYNPRVGVDARGRKWPPLRSKQGRLTAPPNRIMQQQWGIPVAQLAPMRSEPTGRSDSVAVVRQREEALNRRLAALPGIAVSGVGGVIDLTPLQQRCHLDALQHEFVSEEEVNRIIAEVGTDMRFIDDSGLGNLTTMGEVPMLSPRSRDADDDDDAAHETHTARRINGLRATAHLRAHTTGERQLAAQPVAPRARPRQGRMQRSLSPRFTGPRGAFRTTPRFPVPTMEF